MGREINRIVDGWSRWYALPDTQRGKRVTTIKRNKRVDGRMRSENYPKAQYKGFTTEETQALVVRLNAERDGLLKRAKEAYEIKHQFITRHILDEWERHIKEGQTSSSSANRIIEVNNNLFLHFFVHKMQIADPIEWYEKQNIWGAALLNKRPQDMNLIKWEQIRLFPQGKVRSAKTISDVIMFANRFIKFLHSRNPKLFPLLIFAPVSRAILRKHEGSRKLDCEKEGIGKFIPADHWAFISKNGDRQILPFLELAYLLGLRDAETLGVQLKDVKKGYFLLQRQLDSIPKPSRPVFGPSKSRRKRKIFYWETSPEQIYKIVERLPALMHPDTLSRKVSAEMKRLRFSYTLHDFRRTWITRALKAGRPMIEVRDCAGHQHLQTTNLYAMRDEEFGSDVFVPTED